MERKPRKPPDISDKGMRMRLKTSPKRRVERDVSNVAPIEGGHSRASEVGSPSMNRPHRGRTFPRKRSINGPYTRYGGDVWNVALYTRNATRRVERDVSNVAPIEGGHSRASELGRARINGPHAV